MTCNVICSTFYEIYSHDESIIIEYIAISPEKQRNKLGTYLYNEVIGKLKKENKVKHIFAEIEKHNKSINYLFFWSKLGFKILDFHYYQPPLDVNKKEVNTLNLIEYSFDNNNFVNPKILIQLLINYSKYAFNISNPESNPTIIKMLNQLKNKDKIEYIDIKFD